MDKATGGIAASKGHQKRSSCDVGMPYLEATCQHILCSKIHDINLLHCAKENKPYTYFPMAFAIMCLLVAVVIQSGRSLPGLAKHQCAQECHCEKSGEISHTYASISMYYNSIGISVSKLSLCCTDCGNKPLQHYWPLSLRPPSQSS